MKDWREGAAAPLRAAGVSQLRSRRAGARAGARDLASRGRRADRASGDRHRAEFEGALVGADLVEFNPANDPSGMTAAVCAKLVREIAGRMLLEA